MPAEAAGWSRARRALHWAAAAPALSAAPVGVLMAMVPFGDLLAKFVLYQAHKTIGLTAFLAAAAMAAVRLRAGRPAWPAWMPPWRRRLAGGVHLLLLVLVALTAGAGWLAASAAPIHVPTLYLGLIRLPDAVAPDAALFGLLRRAHLALAIGLVGLACGHGGAALLHRLRGAGGVRPA